MKYLPILYKNRCLFCSLIEKKFLLGSPIDSKNKKTPFNMFFSMYVIGCLLK